MSLQDRRVLVTGASRGIGRAIAQEFAHQGARVAVHYHRDQAAAETTRDSLEGGPHLILQADVGEATSGKKLVDATISAMGGLDVLVNNAGIFEDHRVLEVGYDAWQATWLRTIATNLTGPANLCWAAANQMVVQGGGRIINITSRGAFRGEPDCPAYGASKAGLNSLSQSLAKALAPYKVYVFAVAPGWVATDMAAASLSGTAGEAILRDIPLGRVAEAEEIARTVCFLAGDGTASLTGGIIDINGASYLRT